MVIERQVQRTIARCVSIINRYHDDRRSSQTMDAMIADVRAVAARVPELNLAPRETDELILRPVEAALLARYGHELGFRLNRDFLAVFDGFGTPEHVTPRETQRGN